MIRGRGSYLAGPLARFNLNLDRLSPVAAEAARGGRASGPAAATRSRASSSARVEILYALRRGAAPDRRLRAARTRRRVAVEPRRRASGTASPRRRAGSSTTATSSTPTGTIARARIVPPTSQNQRAIEEDLRDFVAANSDLADEELTLRCEQAIRNYDPCISCATHFLRLEVERE